MPRFPSMSASDFMRVLRKKPLKYRITRQSGSHRTLESDEGYPRLTFSWHDGATLAPGLVKKVLVKDVGLTEEEAFNLL
jgi:predicted RNA binding protein YcfA (HicA-like mRNA interferase family)